MTFQIYNHNYNLSNLIRQAGYKQIAVTERGELNCVRPLGADYPRFHLYIIEKPDIITLNLHLDQKKAVYEGATAHSGDYESETVKGEAQRIKDAILRQLQLIK